MINIFQGDPKLVLSVNGSRLVYKGGQPVMDQGLENQALISLFTEPGWAGNVLFPNPDQKIGSDFERTTRQSITLKSLVDIEQAAIRALKNPAFGTVTADASNPIGNQVRVIIPIFPPAGDPVTLILTRTGQNWIFQALNPAHERI